ncbi:MAG: TAXI family TRAP transporter solute-binding subunit [Hyphomicrobiaceae bacterium]
MLTKPKPRWRELTWILLPLALLIAGAFVLAYQFVGPAPPREVTMTTGSERGAYHAFGKQYAAHLAKAGIKLTLKPSAGTLENLSRLTETTASVHIGLVQGGLANATTHPGLSSLGRLFLEPLWLFHRADLSAERLTDLAGKRIAVGAEGSGTRPLVTAILTASGVTSDNSTFLGSSATDAVSMMANGEADAVFLAMAAESELVQKLLHDKSVKVFNFNQAEALTRLNPYLSKVTLPAGVIDMAANIPEADVTLVAPAATLVVRNDLHPAVVGLLVEAAKEIHAGAGLFKKANEFPQALDTELPIDADAARYYKIGPPFLQRYLPFWAAVFFERMMVMIIPIATLLVPLFKVVPMVYQWQVKRRILFWYEKLKLLERAIKSDRSPAQLARYQDEIHRIEDAVSVIPIPLAYSDQLYSLRSAVELVRQRISGIAAGGTSA